MAVMLDTSAGEIVIDLFADECPLAATNFLKLCKIKYYNGCLFYNVQANFICQTGDPTATGKGGMSVYGLINGKHAANFEDEIVKSRKLDKIGLVCMAHEKENTNRSQFFITLRAEDLDDLEGKFTIVGEVAEGFEVLEKINGLYCDEEGRPYQDVRIRHTYVLDDVFDDPSGLVVPPDSPKHSIPIEESVKRRIPYEQSLEEDVEGRTEEEIEESIRRKEAQSRAIVLEMTGDIPDAEVKPPTEVLFVCKLNQVTTDADLELIFSQFGTIKQCEIIRDFKTGDSLNYAFIEFETDNACIKAYEKMNNVLIDDRRIKVDFSQSVSKLWNKYLQQPRGVGKRVMGGNGPAKAASPRVMERGGQFSDVNSNRSARYNPPQQQGLTRPSSFNDAPHHATDRDKRHRDSEVKEMTKAKDSSRNAGSRGVEESGRRDRFTDRDRSRDRIRHQEKLRDGDRHRDKHHERDRDRERDRERDKGNDDRHRGYQQTSRVRGEDRSRSRSPGRGRGRSR